ncbi:MAG: YkgJ family cysteine cluster protein [Opitutae bacterium]|nr:YkgJ family cysteine cluster protein [Opitutae bacterium]MDG1301850.1 YkgJ family cysteine cluster protein [Opitutae bacterium]
MMVTKPERSRLANKALRVNLRYTMPPSPTKYDCTQCGACCRSFPIFASEADAMREPAIRQEARALPEYLQAEGKAYQLFPLPFHARCPYLKEDELCRIYESRPSVCRRFEAGSEQCIEARRRQGIGEAD